MKRAIYIFSIIGGLLLLYIVVYTGYSQYHQLAYSPLATNNITNKDGSLSDQINNLGSAAIFNNTTKAPPETQERAYENKKDNELYPWEKEILARTCDQKIMPNMRHDVSGCVYSEDGAFLNKNFTARAGVCASTLADELSKHEYSFVDGCLYRGNNSILEKPLHSLAIAGEFGSTGEGEEMTEWFRFNESGVETIFFAFASGCGGCVWGGPYLKIDSNDQVSLHNAKLPPLLQLLLSPTNKLAIEIEPTSYEYPNRPAQLFLYDFRAFTRTKELLTLADNQTVYEFGAGGLFIIDNALRWNDEDTVEINPVEMNKYGEPKLHGPGDLNGTPIFTGEKILLNIKMD